ncbi:hypothetical protein BGX26_011668 [Mortierella sp. AD094]|nr:hypothetical protein BGX26_011668 [Mortierella sp. AD094]
MTFPNVNTPQQDRPRVLIVGGGIGGLMLAILLEKADIRYAVFERAPEVKALGTATYLSGNLAPIFKQVGVYDKLFENGMPPSSINAFEENRKLSFALDMTVSDEMCGAKGFAIPRATLYDVLLEHVPAHNIFRGAKVLSYQQGENGVHIKCSNGREYEGDILVGADGAYSSVRQRMYEKLKKENKLPASDGVPLPYVCMNLVGYTDPMDPAKVPELNGSECHFDSFHAAGTSYGWSTFICKNNVIGWAVMLQLDEKSSKENDTFRSTECTAEEAQSMCDQSRHFPITCGDGTMTLGDLIDNTPKSRISKVALEEKVFDTWYHEKTVLIGDACHKVHPACGRGAQLAIHDAVALANWLDVMPAKPTIEEAEKIFKEYKAERYSHARDSRDQGRMLSLCIQKTKLNN